MATITFTATTPEGEIVTRTSGTMPYVAYAGGTWHKSFAAAHKAATDRYHAVGTQVVPVLPTAINGKVDDRLREIATTGWGDIPAATIAALIEDKEAEKARQAGEVVVQLAMPVEDDTIQAEMDDQAAKRAKAAADRRRQRADKKARELGLTGEAILASAKAAAEAQAPVEKSPAPEAEMVLVKVDGKPQARMDTVSGKLVWRNSAKGRAARAAGLWK